MRSTTCALTLGLLLATAAPVVAQSTSPPPPAPQGMGIDDRARARDLEQVSDELDRALDEAERARLAGNCAARNSALYRAENIVDPNSSQILERTNETQLSYTFLRLPPALRDVLSQRYSDARARPCPPSGGTAPPAPPAQVAVPPTPPSQTQPPGGVDGPEESILEQIDPRPVGPNGPELPPTPPARGITGLQIGLGYGVSSIPRTNYGFIRDGAAGSDQPAAFGERHVRTWDFTGRARVGAFGLLLLGYRTGDASNRTEIPVSTTGGAQGTVNTATSPGGSTGGAANRGLTVDTNTEFKEFSGGARFDVWTFGGESTWSPVQSPRRRDRGVSGALTGELFINYRDRNHFGEIDIPGVPAGTPPVINQVIEQDVDELEIGAALGVETHVPLGGGARFTFGVDLGAYYFDHGVDTLQTNRQLVGGPQDLAFTLEQQDSESGIAARGDASAELAFNVSRPLEFFVRGEASYSSHRAQVVNPFSGNFVLAGGTTFLDADDAFDWSIGIGLRIQLGAGSPDRFR